MPGFFAVAQNDKRRAQHDSSVGFFNKLLVRGKGSGARAGHPKPVVPREPQDLDANEGNSFPGKAQKTRRGPRNIEKAPMHKGPPVIDTKNERPAIFEIGNPDACAQG